MGPSDEDEPTLDELRDRLKVLRRTNRELEIELTGTKKADTQRAVGREGPRDSARVIAQVRKAKDFHIFQTQAQLSGEGTFDWEGSIEDFLAFAKDAGVKTLYLSQWVPEDDETPSEAVGDVEVGFLLDGRLHVFSTVEYRTEEGEATPEEGSVVTEYLTAHRVEIIPQVADALLGHPADNFGTASLAAQLLRQRLREKLGPIEMPMSHIHSLEPDTSPAGQLMSEVEGEIVKAVQEKERPIVESLYPKWLDFARQIGGHVLSQGDLSVFLDREKAHFTRDGRQALWTRVKIDLRNERTSEKLARGRK